MLIIIKKKREREQKNHLNEEEDRAVKDAVIKKIMRGTSGWLSR